jgi:hypothetical protein
MEHGTAVALCGALTASLVIGWLLLSWGVMPPELTITETVKTSYGYRFRRSDGRHFFMRSTQDGSASVFEGIYNRPPQGGITDLATNVTDKIEHAKRAILAF